MILPESVRTAVRGLYVNKLRSALTTLGIVIGVAAVIVLVALGNGLQAGFNETFGKLGNQIVISKTFGSAPGGGTAKELTDSDVTALRDSSQAPAIAMVTPTVSGIGLFQAGSGRYRSPVAGSTADYPQVHNRKLAAGSFFTPAQERASAKVVVLGPVQVTDLYAGDAGAAVGQDIRIGRTKFRIIGVLAPDGQQDDLAVMPLGSLRTNLLGGSENVDQITVTATSAAQVSAALEQVNTILSERRHITDPAARDFDAEALQNLLTEANQFLTYLTLFTATVAGISLVVGGVGVANIMLVSVTERTREIGIRKAVGASRRAILRQFLIESCALTSMGGLMGITIGVGIVLAGAAALKAAAPTFPAPEPSLPSIALAFGISMAIGLLAGGYPANRAARMRPIEALRYE